MARSSTGTGRLPFVSSEKENAPGISGGGVIDPLQDQLSFSLRDDAAGSHLRWGLEEASPSITPRPSPGLLMPPINDSHYRSGKFLSSLAALCSVCECNIGLRALLSPGTLK